jgi:alpha-beta hydrolase superfamily lysophospholipase
VLGVVAPDDSHYRFCFHWPDEEPELMQADLASYRPYTDVVRGDASTPWGSATLPACAVTMMTEGAVAKEAAAIDVPVLIACGERDVVPDPLAERAAYRGTHDVSLTVVPRMAHMHNFARTRALLWDAIEHFAQGIRPVVRA